MFTTLATGGMLADGAEVVTREQVEAQLEGLRSVDALTAGINGAKMRQRAEEDWRELLDEKVCPWSPVPLLEDLLDDPSWTEIDVSPGAVVDNFLAVSQQIMDDFDATQT